MTDEPPTPPTPSEHDGAAPADGEPKVEVLEIEAEVPPPPEASVADLALRAAVKGEAAPVASEATTASTSAAPSSATPAPPPATSTTSSTSSGASAPMLGPSGRPLPPKRKRPPTADDGDDEDEDAEPKQRRRWPLVVGAVALVAGGVTALVLAGRANHRKLYFHCGADKITALRGRSFPPWGKERIGGPGWKAIDIPPATECIERATKDPIELEGWYLDALVEQATLALGADGGDTARAERQLQQALLLARSPDRRDQRKDIDRLLADVTYSGGAAQVKAATAALRAAATQFDDAAGRRPRHAADAAAWAAFARATADRLEAGPGGEEPAAPTLLMPAAPSRPPAPPGVALPVEPPPDAGVLAPPDVDAATPGIPGGGVLM